MKTTITMKDLRFSDDLLTKNDKIAILEYINKNKDCFNKEDHKEVIYHHRTRLEIFTDLERGLRVSKAVMNGEIYWRYIYVSLRNVKSK